MEKSRNFVDEYAELDQNMFDLVLECEDYIIDNWEKVKDWTKINITEYDFENNKRYSFGPGLDLNNEFLNSALNKNRMPIKTFKILAEEVAGSIIIEINSILFRGVSNNNIIKIAQYIQENAD